MTTPKTVKQLVKEINALSSSLSDAVPRGSKSDKIWSVMNTKEGDILHETFNCWFDALFVMILAAFTIFADVAGGDLKDESDVEGFSWDELLIEDEDEETMDWSE
jgi:hypothetical protein